MRKGNIATMAVLAATLALGGCSKSDEVAGPEARAQFIAECTSAGTGEAEVSAEKMGAYCECMADPSLAMQAAMADGTMPDQAELEKMQNDSIACTKHLE